MLWDGAVVDGERRGGMQFDDSSDVKAKKSAVWLCPHCATAVRDSHRADMYRNYRWLKDGQTADKAGIVTGTPPPNSTASFWYSSLYVPWWTFGKLAAEYVKTRGDEEKERDFQIHRLVIPWVNPSIEIETVTTEAIRAHVIDYPKDEIPAEADLVVCAADVHRHLVYWVAVAFRKADQTAWLVHEGVVEVWTPEGLARGPQEAEQRAVLSALREWHQTLQAGWPKTPYKEPLKYQFVGVDYQYCSDAVSRFVREAGQAKHFAVQGYGTSSRVRWKAPRFHEDAKADEIRRAHVYSTILADRTRLLHSDADWAKRAVHKALGVPPGSPGTLYLYPEVSHAFTKHLQAERWIDDEGGGHFEVVNNNNHFLDCMGMAYVLADLAGVTQLGPPAARPARPPARRVRKAEPGLNYRRLNYRG